MKDPEPEWFDLHQATVDRLKGEKEALMKRLKELELEESGTTDKTTRIEVGPNAEFVPRESWEAVIREKYELEDKVTQNEKRLLRLQQVRYIYRIISRTSTG